MRNRMNMGISLIGRLALLGTVFLTIAAVHGAALKSSATAVEAGTELALEGTGFHADQTVTLVHSESRDTTFRDQLGFRASAKLKFYP